MPVFPQLYLLIFIGVLMATNAISVKLWLDARDDVAVCETNHENAVKAAAGETKKAEANNRQTIEDINHAIPILVAQTEKNALDNYRRRFGGTAGSNSSANPNSSSSLGNGFDGSGVRNNGANSTGALPPNGAEGVERTQPTGMDVGCTPDPRFLNEASAAAVLIKGWNDFADKERLPREK